MSGDAPVRIVLVDDHPMFRDGLRKLLESDTGFSVCGEAGDARAAVATVGELTCRDAFVGAYDQAFAPLEASMAISPATALSIRAR
jgi:chemotaxis response regulator CheB